MSGLRVVLAEDNVLLRQGLSRLLDEHPDIDEVVAVDDYPSLLAAVEENAPCVVLTDIRMPPNHADEGIRAAAHWRSTRPDLGVLVLSQYADAEGALALMAQGSRGRGYLLKERVSDIDQVVTALAAVGRGESIIDPEIVDALMNHQLRFANRPIARLTPREVEVLAAIVTGASNAAIGTDLGITSRAVEKHINSIFTKLDLPVGDQTHRRVAAVLLYLGDSGPSTSGPAPST